MSQNNTVELNAFEDIFGIQENEQFPWESCENPFEAASFEPFGATEPIIFGEENMNVVDVMTSPCVLNSKMDKETGNTIYMDTLKLIQQVEILLGNKKHSSEINNQNAIEFINARLAMRTLNMAMEYKRLLGENQTYQYLLDKMKPFDGSMQEVILKKENEIKRLQVELDLYKLKTEETEKKMVDLRNLYETRRKEDFKRVKTYLQEGVKLRNTKATLEDENKVLTHKVKYLTEKYKDYKKKLRYATSESLYQQKQKINARKKIYKLKIQLNESFKISEEQKYKLESISKRVNALDTKYDGLKKHFKDFFENNQLCECSICMDNISTTDEYHTCSNSSCGLIFHIECLKNTSTQMSHKLVKCQFCQVEDPIYPVILGDTKEEPDSYYESEGDEEFVPGDEETIITQRDIDMFQSYMFLSPDEVEELQAEEEDDIEQDPDYVPGDDDESTDDSTDEDDDESTNEVEADDENEDSDEEINHDSGTDDDYDILDDEVEILYVLTE
jgi:hypothetical protein